MKKGITLLLLLTAAAAGGNANAKTLEDILKEKGVITEEDYKEVTKEAAKSKPVDYTLGQGFTFTSPDEKFKMSLGSCLQFRYTLMDRDDNNNTAAGSAQDFSKFELRRIKLYFNGYAYFKDLTYKLQMNFANLNGGTNKNGGILEETWMNYRLFDEAQFRFGQDKVQFGREFITSTANLQFVDQSVVTTAFVPGYDTGIMVHGKIAGGLANYNIGGYGGLGQNTFRSTSDNALAARLTVNPLGDMKYSESDVEFSEKPLVSVGANYFRDTLNPSELTYGTNNELNFMNGSSTGSGFFAYGNPRFAAARQISANESIDFNLVGFDAAFKWRGLSVQGEYFLGQADGKTTNNTLRARGFYAQAGYFVIPKQLELAARYAYLDPNRDIAKDHWVESTGGVSWYINQHNLKLQADYTNIHRQPLLATTNPGPNANPTDDKQFRIQAQILF